MYAREPRKQEAAPDQRTEAAGAVRRGSGPPDLLSLQRTAGNAAVVQLMATSSAPVTVARVMDEKTFKGQTSAPGLRSKSAITNVDQALRNFHALQNPSQQQQVTALGAIVNACLTYLNAKPNGQRSAGVENLRDQADSERSNLVLGPKQQILSQGEKRFRDVLAQIDAGLAIIRQHDFALGEFHRRNLPEDARGEGQALSPVDFQQMIRSYIDELNALRDDQDLPAETRAVIEEVVGVANLVTTMRYPTGMPGMSVNQPAPEELADTEYTFNVDTQARGGTPFLLGHITHELTHVSAHQAFNSSSVMALAPVDTTPQQIAQLAQQRAQTMRELLALLNADTTFHPDQYDLLVEKLDYGRQGGKLGRYATVFRQAGKINDEEEARLLAWEEAAGQNSGTLVEYDTVLNQMLVYLHLWRIDQANPFYVRLRTAAAEATTRRAAAQQ
ncbi:MULTISPECIES: hypothetical protein [Kitasatospora]|uniref:hypothetical protein n=1 Tax=Kitasatospora TaxID=2063 RepID=UPI000C70A894|nr:hypothetical protein [Kitasatospora sp. GP30]MDH6139354.1 hypothetical protein [Kitasatospora sp. GP30]